MSNIENAFTQSDRARHASSACSAKAFPTQSSDLHVLGEASRAAANAGCTGH